MKNLDLDEADPLSALRDRFTIPQDPDGSEEAYFAGNSLGLMPKDTPPAMLSALSNWGNKGVRGHFEGDESWYQYDEVVSALQTDLVGAQTKRSWAYGVINDQPPSPYGQFLPPFEETEKNTHRAPRISVR